MATPQLRLSWAAWYLVAPVAYAVVLVAQPDGILAGIAYFYVALATALIAFWLAEHHGVPLTRLGLERPRFSDVAWGVGGFLVGGSLFPLFDAAFQAMGSSMFWSDMDPWTSQPALQQVLFVLGAILLVAFAEELWFRGYAFGYLEQRGVRPALQVGFTSIVFGALHLYGGPGFAAFILVWSLIAGALRLRTGRLWAPLTMHILNNAFARIAVPLLFAN